MKHEILSKLNEAKQTIGWLLDQITTETALSLRNYILGKNPEYPITLKEAAQIAEILETDIFTLFPELPRPVKPKYADINKEVDKRLADMAEPEYMELSDETVLQENDQYLKNMNGALLTPIKSYTVGQTVELAKRMSYAPSRRYFRKSAPLEAHHDHNTTKA